ncbi:MAG TPA: hypothetical protein VEC93_13335, partial [Anaerolineae bacterium]|nr:hypothetical protein [Anaerolineae bacterium]
VANNNWVVSAHLSAHFRDLKSAKSGWHNPWQRVIMKQPFIWEAWRTGRLNIDLSSLPEP